MPKTMSFPLLILCFVICSTSKEIEGNRQDVTVFRSPNATSRQFGLGIFNLVRFSNDVCETSRQSSGTCLTYKQCRQYGGIADGNCASGFGVCCALSKTCNEEIRLNGTQFVSPGQGVTGANACRITVHKASRRICQVRLDLLQFQTVGPNQKTGRCERDYFRVSGQDTNSIVPTICGENTGQHLIFDVGSSAERFYLQMTTSSNSTMSRVWRIRVVQIACDNPARAPSGCLQYHKGISGNIKSFNYDNARSQEIGYPANTNYAICIRKELSHCGGNFMNQGVYGVGEPNQQHNLNCDLDYIVIGGQRFCGGTSSIGSIPEPKFNATIRGPGPIIVTFVTSIRNLQSETDSSPGFNLHYSQNDCFAA